MKKIIIITSILFIILLFAAVVTNKKDKYQENKILIYNKYDENDLDETVSGICNSSIKLNNGNIEVLGDKINIENGVIKIESAGIYSISGTISNLQILVDVSKDSEVRLILNDVEIQNDTVAPIYIKSAKKTIITLAENTTNILKDNNLESLEDISATIFSKDDLTINGKGNLVVYGNYKDGIVCKDNLKIINSNIEVISSNDGIVGADSVSIKNSNLKITSQGDGITSTKEENYSYGNVIIEDSDINIVSGNTIKEYNKNDKDKEIKSSKGIKAINLISINGGKIEINSFDDSIHSNNAIKIYNGNLLLSSNDDGIHADNEITIDGGNIVIKKSYEGIESLNITINDGNIHINSSDDGINICSLTNILKKESNNKLIINGGYLYVDALGDGIDSNGSIDINGGIIIVNGPTSNGDAPIDYDNLLNITGGTLVAAGSSSMFQSISDISTQCCVTYYFSDIQKAGTLISIKDSSKEDTFITFSPSKDYEALLISSKELELNKSYKMYFGGSIKNFDDDGIYFDSSYNSSNKYISFTISNINTILGNKNNFRHNKK